MKKFLFLAFLAIFLVGCSADIAEETDQPTIPDEEPVDVEEESSEDALPEPEAPEQDESAEEELETEVDRTIVVEGRMYYFEPSEISVLSGETIEFVFENIEGTHDMVIPELGVGTSVISAGESESFVVTFDEEGVFDFECSVGSHAEQGMIGQIVVE
ncbi:MAG: plastocyanin/azurin family copper-binding protein [Candidatus Woesearchaeota archaeon]